jgi:HipA-like C-terminal domain
VAIAATAFFRPLRGGAQSKLIMGDDDNLYVVKFQNNPQHLRVLANEWFGTRLAQAVGLTVPPCEAIKVSRSLIDDTPELAIDLGSQKVRCCPGLQFGSRFLGGLMPGRVAEYLPHELLRGVKNAGEFCGVLALDKWACNADGRQAIYVRERGRQYRAAFIDHGYFFNGGHWSFTDSPLRGIFGSNAVYYGVIGWESFDPWLTEIEQLDPDKIWNIARTIPGEWYEADVVALERLVDRLINRKGRVRELITEFRESSANPFPRWAGHERATAPLRWKTEQWLLF